MLIERNETGFLTRLARDKRGNTLAIAAAMLIPLIGLTGSAIDTSRLYVIKTRLQQACDAGVLAGRKFMTDTALTTPLDQEAASQAQTFFANNFRAGWFTTQAVTFTPTKVRDGGGTVANAVSGTASATVPMAVMGFFGIGARPVTVQCRANYDLADTDVMFVLDTTGSMACTPSAAAGCAGAPTEYTREDGSKGLYAKEATGSKLQGLRDAVKLFEQTMRENADTSTKVRYGFVTYSSSTNVGGVIPAAYLEGGSWNYDTRWPRTDYNFGGAVNNTTTTGVTQTECTTNKRSPATGYKLIGTYYGAHSWNGTPTWSNANGGTCAGTRQIKRIEWRYERKSLDLTTFKTGTATVNPSRVDGGTSTWRGCVEELNSRTDSTFTNLDTLPADLNPDTIPSRSTTGLWRPMWPDSIWLRNGTAALDVKDELVDETRLNQNYAYNYGHNRGAHRGFLTACGMPARTLDAMSKDEVAGYVDHEDFKGFGYTYHDIGMIWGARLLSPNGIFASTTAPHPGRNPPSRNIVFMTDGNMDTNNLSYGTYGLEALFARIGGNDTEEQARHERRFQAVCSYAKARLGITIYVVAFGSGVTLNSSLTSCASPGQAFSAANTADLKTTFQDIAERVAMLRITR